MINIQNQTLTQGGVTEPIVGFVTEWVHPFKGLFETLSEAVRSCDGTDFEAEEILRPITVAVTATMKEPLIR